ncbi:MAG: hypothetical protein A3J83_04745 [Elusimicrobia bacterium RIFOXYA2_FULL_40_6]|nr:MAG: hypothetical protein A3J83_04745 [Elusimicrobia bacterium RIFOXYA2_FULL_40_6]
MTDNLNSFLQTAGKRRNIYIYCEHILFFVVINASCLLYLSLLDYCLPLPIAFNYSFWWIFFLLFAFTAVHGYFTARISPEELILEIQGKTPLLKDNYLNAWQIKDKLSQAESMGISVELSEEFIRAVSKDLNPVQLKKIINFKNLSWFSCSFTALAVIIFSFWLKTPEILTDNSLKFIFPYNSIEFNRYVKVFPGTAALPLGSDFEIVVDILSPEASRYEPQLYTQWGAVKLNQSGNRFVSDKIHLISKVSYYVKWKALRSNNYFITPVPLPKLGDFHITYYFPSYTQMASREGKMFGDMPLLLGTRIEFSAVSNKNLKNAALFTSYGRKIPLRVNSGDKIKGELIIEKDGECWFELIPEDGVIDPAPAHYPLFITKDREPRIAILAPGEDLIVAQDAKVKIVYKAEDDFGVSNVELKWAQKYPEKSVEIKRMNVPKNEITDEYEWALSDISAKPGDIITYYLKVYDNDTITGPKSSLSEMYTLEIYNYETEHAKVEEGLKKFREELLNVLGEQISAKEKLDKLLKDQQQPAPEQNKELIDTQENIKKHNDDVNEILKKMLDKMENDPYTNYQIYQEHKAISQSLEQLSQNQMPDAKKFLAQKNYPSAKSSMEDTIKNLEKMNLLAEDVLQYQKMEDLINSGNKLNDLAQGLEKGLQSPQNPENMKKLNEALDAIKKTMEKMNELMKKMPQDLPEEFVNQQAVKDINTQQMQSSADNIRDALNSNNMEKALKEAQNLLKQMQKMLKTMQEASNSVGFGSADKKMDEEVRKSSLELGEIISQQSRMVEDTQFMEKIRQDKISKEQEKILDRLAQMQREAINKTRRIPELNECIGPMEKVYGELSAKRIVKSKEWLKDIIVKVGFVQRSAEEYSNRISSAQVELWNKVSKLNSGTKEVLIVEQEILKTLESEIQPEFSEAEKEQMRSLSEKQNKIQNRALELDRKIQEISRQSAEITPEISYNLRMAAHEMTNAQSSLAGSKPKEALQSAQKALDFLTSSGDSMKSAGEGIKMMQSKFGKPMALPTQRKSAMSGGKTGVQSGAVELPDISDYLPPKEFREELIKALKEKYPQTYEQVIKQYYRKLTE